MRTCSLALPHNVCCDWCVSADCAFCLGEGASMIVPIALVLPAAVVIPWTLDVPVPTLEASPALGVFNLGGVLGLVAVAAMFCLGLDPP